MSERNVPEVLGGTELLECVWQAAEAFENGHDWRPFIGLLAHHFIIAEAERDREPLPQNVTKLRTVCRHE